MTAVLEETEVWYVGDKTDEKRGRVGEEKVED